MHVTHGAMQAHKLSHTYSLSSEVFIPRLQHLMLWVPELQTQSTPLNSLV